MPNSLTGDFEAVLQVGGRVIDRLMASLHQNAALGYEALPQSAVGDAAFKAIGGVPSASFAAYGGLPTFPHSIFLRIGDPLPDAPSVVTAMIGQPTDLQDASQFDSVPSSIGAATAPAASGTFQQASTSSAATAAALAMASALDGVRGTVRAQAGAPRIELINAARRFIVEVPIRARYTPDLGTTPLPEFIHGVARAEYSVREITIPGDKRLLRFAVVPANVTFQSYGPNTSDDTRIARQLARLLQIRFVPSDQEIGFPLNTIRALVAGGFSAITVALPISDEEPQGSLDSHVTALLAGSDFAIAVSRDTIVSLADTMLAGLAARQGQIPLAWAVYDISVQDPFKSSYSVEALGGTPGNAGIITVTGRLAFNTDDRWLPNVEVKITQRLKLALDSVSESLALTKDGPTQSQRFYSNPAAAVIDVLLKTYIDAIVDFEVTKAINEAAPELGNINGVKSRLDGGLKKLDAAAKSRFTAADFSDDGIVLRGQIQLSPRFGPVIEFNKLSTLDGYSACPSWLPGGRIDSFHWRWSWFYPTQSALITPPTQGGSTLVHSDRFIMRAPAGVPGLHGSPTYVMTGVVCLNIRGVQIDPQSGDPVQVDTALMVLPTPVCQFLSPQMHVDLPRGRERLLSRLTPKSDREPQTVWPEVAVLDLGGPPMNQGHNTLVCYFSKLPGPEDIRAIRLAIEGCGRQDAGLLVTIVLGNGDAVSERGDVRSELQRAVAAIPTYVFVTDDVQRGWARAFDVNGDRRGIGLRLVTSGGRLAWSSDGSIEVGSLAAALREHLVAGPLPEIRPMALGIEPGARAPEIMLELAAHEHVSLRALRGGRVVLCFVRAESASSEAQLTNLERRADVFERQSSRTIAIVDQASLQIAHAIKQKLSLNYHVFGDPDSLITRRWGVRVWPTTVVIDERGIVERVHVGAESATFDLAATGDRAAKAAARSAG